VDAHRAGGVRHTRASPVRMLDVSSFSAAMPAVDLSPAASQLAALVIATPLLAVVSSFGAGVGVGTVGTIAAMPEVDTAALTLAQARIVELETLVEQTQQSVDALLKDKALTAERMREETEALTGQIGALKQKLGDTIDALELQQNDAVRTTEQLTEQRRQVERKVEVLEVEVTRLRALAESDNPIVNFAKWITGELA
jgi:hypothetical protein